jgi:hypothetical protein
MDIKLDAKYFALYLYTNIFHRFTTYITTDVGAA